MDKLHPYFLTAHAAGLSTPSNRSFTLQPDDSGEWRHHNWRHVPKASFFIDLFWDIDQVQSSLIHHFWSSEILIDYAISIHKCQMKLVRDLSPWSAQMRKLIHRPPEDYCRSLSKDITNCRTSQILELPRWNLPPIILFFISIPVTRHPSCSPATLRGWPLILYIHCFWDDMEVQGVL